MTRPRIHSRCQKWELQLALALLVFGVAAANNIQVAPTPHKAAFVAHFANRCTYFHNDTLPFEKSQTIIAGFRYLATVNFGCAGIVPGAFG